jgi:hypothetical protein
MSVSITLMRLFVSDLMEITKGDIAISIDRVFLRGKVDANIAWIRLENPSGSLPIRGVRDFSEDS